MKTTSIIGIALAAVAMNTAALADDVRVVSVNSLHGAAHFSYTVRENAPTVALFVNGRGIGRRSDAASAQSPDSNDGRNHSLAAFGSVRSH